MTTESHHVINVAKRDGSHSGSAFFFRVIHKGSDGGPLQLQAVYDELRARFPADEFDIDVTYWECRGKYVSLDRPKLDDDSDAHALTAAQLLAIVQFAERNGRLWKQKLGDAWMTGRYASSDDSGSLQQIRNVFGPSWLASFKLPK